MSRRVTAVVVTIAAALVALVPALHVQAATTWATTQQSAIADPGAGSQDNLGGYTFVCPFCLGAAALSADGNTALVGAPGTTNGEGAAYVFTRSGTTWSQQANLVALVPTPPADASFGDAVALSADGNTALVSEPTTAPGRVYVFTRSGNTWSRRFELSTAASPALSGFATFGAYVALSGDGRTAVVGADGANSFAGEVYVFTGAGSSWSQQSTLSSHTTPAVAAGDNFGEAVSISGDGNTVIAGAPGAGPGEAYVFGRTAGSWSQLGAELSTVSHPAPSGFFQFGFSVTMSGDGTTAIAGAIRGNGGINGTGAAYLYSRSGSTWSQVTELSTDMTDTLPSGALFGDAAALNDTGTVAIVGANGFGSGSGNAYVFTKTGSAWTEVDNLATLPSTSPAPQSGALFGTAVAMSADPTLLVAAPRQGTGGTLYVYTMTTPTTSSLAASANPVVAGAAETFTDTVCGSTPTGTVTFTDASTTLGTGTLAAGGGTGCSQATLTTSALAAGSQTIHATYAGDPSNTASSATLAVTVTAASIPVPSTGAGDGSQGTAMLLVEAGGLLAAAAVLRRRSAG